MATVTGSAKRRLAWLLGRETEQRAERLLGAAGLRTLDRNWRCRIGELDLVMAEGDTLVFVEVRRRSRRDRATAAESVDWRKRRRIVNAARRYLQKLRHEPACRFDVVTVDGPKGDETLRWIRGAFDAGDVM
ncbi:MAG: YraN family protein [Gammaproteobacteria bacterium]|nr:YraN family protein [Gammaproteobacteria bacterium]